MTCAVSAAVREGAEAVVCASTGNTAASAAAYAARGGLTRRVIVPEGKIATGKLAQALMHGARVIALRGNFDQALTLVRELAKRRPIALVNSVNPFRLEGQKTASLRAARRARRDRRAVHPGRQRRQRHRLLEGLHRSAASRPRMLGFQAEGAAPLVHGAPVEAPETVASAIRIGNPARWEEALDAFTSSRGAVDAVSDAQILDAYRFLAARGGRLLRAGLGRRRRRPARPRRRGRRADRLRAHRPRAQGPADRARPAARSCPASPTSPPSSGRSTVARCTAAAWCACPASSANLGPGFDVLAAALGAAHGARGRGDRRASRSTPTSRSPATARNLAVRGVRDAAPGRRLRVHDPLATSRSRGGLGTSAAAYVAGLDGRRLDLRARRRPAARRDASSRAIPTTPRRRCWAASCVCAGGARGALRRPGGAGGDARRAAQARAHRARRGRRCPPQVPLADAVLQRRPRRACSCSGSCSGDWDLVARGPARPPPPAAPRAAVPAVDGAACAARSELGALGATISGAGPVRAVLDALRGDGRRRWRA